ncbi:MAG: AAA family ATPase [Chloroflexi bacterium]|nr:AAA family ATPase [Chloroflexota bacterium]
MPPQAGLGMRPNIWDFVWLAVVGVLASLPFIVLTLVGSPRQGPPPRPIALNDLALAIQQSAIASVDVDEHGGVARDRLGSMYSFTLEPKTTLLKALSTLGVTPEQLATITYSVRDPSPAAEWSRVLAPLVPMVLLGTMVVLAMSTGSDPNTQVLQLMRHRARRVIGSSQSIGFADVAGADEAKQELQEIVQFLSAPRAFKEVGARCPRGVLLVGPPGTGKTLLARAVAGEARVPFFNICGSGFVEIVAGVGASRVRDLFDEASRIGPSILFVDEIDAIGRRRGLGIGGVNTECEQTLNQLLVEMDGFDSSSQIVVIAATNRVDILDPALLRPGRFDRQVLVSPPNRAQREAILRVHSRGKPLDPTVDLVALAGMTTGCSGADLATIMNEGAILAVRRGKCSIGTGELDAALERLQTGIEYGSRIVPPEAKSRRAYREAGRALAMHVLEHHPPVHKITLLRTRSLDAEDRALLTSPQLEARVTVALAGTVAERLVYADAASNDEADIRLATQIAETMVRRYGMSRRLGPVALSSTVPRSYSEATARCIDEEVRLLIEAGYARAVGILNEHGAAFQRLAVALLEHERVEGELLKRLLP